ncbi:hypothetical protein BO71DRAFT_408588 [Aspergillus ellipticus CBS 707.79]|uniref:Uncharacterized protein n=1 Tax=Aspergillus ellipticus CBS 707.79 TaxID=1448320 RepID=A0A319DD87_9EURO|nr:hypothetical protein BO71DRAFT_408588 [Aspergillus ellipticus CBS 707.79]
MDSCLACLGEADTKYEVDERYVFRSPVLRSLYRQNHGVHHQYSVHSQGDPGRWDAPLTRSPVLPWGVVISGRAVRSSCMHWNQDHAWWVDEVRRCYRFTSYASLSLITHLTMFASLGLVVYRFAVEGVRVSLIVMGRKLAR